MYYFEKWLNRQAQRHSGKSKFRQDGSFSRKERDQSKEEWRKRKGFKKDSAKGGTWCKCGRYLKTQDHRLRRRYERQLIKNDKWEQIYHHKEMFVSSWDAC